MKSVFRFLALGILTTTFAAAGYAQAAPDACADITAQQALYKQFTDLYPKTSIEDRKAAVGVAKQYIEKYGSCPDAKPQIDYFNGYIPPVEKGIADDIEKARKAKLYSRFNDAVKAKNWDEVYAAGKDVLAEEKDPKIALDVTILLGSIGLDEAAKGNDKYNDDTIKYAQQAIKLIEGGAKSDNFGTGITYKNSTNALAWLNYTIAYIKNDRQKDTKGAVAYYYKVTQYEASPKKNPAVYYNLGKNYYAQLDAIETDRQAKVVAAGKKDTDETKALFAQARGYADRVLDAYSRAYNLAGTDPKTKAAKDSLYTELKNVYAFRYQNKENALDALIASTKTKPMPDPSTPITPVIEVEPTPAATTGTTTTPVATPATTTKPAATTKPATPTKPAATTTKPATPTKPVAKKTTPKR